MPPNTETPPAPRPSAFLEQIIRFLMPFFITTAVDIDAARFEILDTLDSYGARTRAEMLNAAQIIAFGMSTLDTLAEAKAADLSPSLRLRFRGCANGLNRATQQNENTLKQRLACDLPRDTDPLDDISDHQMQEIIQQAQAKIDSHRAALRQTEQHTPLLTPAMINNPHQMNPPPPA
jgi:hypothetical protein